MSGSNQSLALPNPVPMALTWSTSTTPVVGEADRMRPTTSRGPLSIVIDTNLLGHAGNMSDEALGKAVKDALNTLLSAWAPEMVAAEWTARVTTVVGGPGDRVLM